MSFGLLFRIAPAATATLQAIKWFLQKCTGLGAFGAATMRGSCMHESRLTDHLRYSLLGARSNVHIVEDLELHAANSLKCCVSYHHVSRKFALAIFLVRALPPEKIRSSSMFVLKQKRPKSSNAH